MSPQLESTKDREIKLDTRTGIYYYRGTPIRGLGEVKHPLGVRSFGAAVLAKKDYLLRLRGIEPGAKDILFRDYAKLFLQERKKKAPATFEQAFYSLKELLPFFETYSMRNVNDRSWEEYKDYQSQIKPDRNLRYDRRHLLMMIHRLKAKGIISEIPEFPYQDEGSKRKRVLTSEEVRAIFTRAKGTIYGLALFMYLMGCRPGEVLGAAWPEFDLDKGLWNLPAERTKTRKARSMMLNQTVLTWLLARRSEQVESAAEKGIVPTGWVFPAKDSNGEKPVDRYNKQWTRLMRDCGIAGNITPYFLRHTFLTECAKKVRDGSASLVLITKYAGTSIEQFEKTYLHVEGQETRAVAEMMESPL